MRISIIDKAKADFEYALENYSLGSLGGGSGAIIKYFCV